MVFSIKIILWVSKEELLGDQIDDLRRIYGQDISTINFTGNIWDVDALRPALSSSDIIAIPDDGKTLNTIWGFNIGKPIIISKRSADRKPRLTDCSNGCKTVLFTYEHLGWYRVLRYEYCDEKL